MAFDPNAATARYIDSLGPAALQKAHDYTVGKEWMLLWSLLVAALVTWLIVRSGILDRLEAKLAGKRRNVSALLVAFAYFVISAILTLPWAIYADWWREKSYGRTAQPLSDWLLQLGIATAISAIVGALFFMGVYWLMRRAGRRWWIWSGVLAAVAFTFVILLAPVLIEPLFNKYEPVPPGQVRDAVVEMAQKAGIPPDKVYMYNGSRQSNNFTANAGGVGSTARVAISDVAFKSASLDEVRAVTGHEIGHYVLKHTWWGILVYSVAAIILFWVADRTFRWFARLFGSSAALADPRGLPVLMFMVSLFGLLTLPFFNTFSRTLESQADMYSLQTENRPDALSTALVKTAEYRYPRPGAVEEFIFYDHPSVERRVRVAMEWKAAHPGPPTQ
ncbi:M48 family metallopeptidase [Sphingomonas segetis]|jgi:STE24 endopeptidase|uniref:M48 family metallopeptidase n=1 Tax=Sphingomonas segetis TaxID=1104779 RepID=UPI0012D31CD0|nr:M48 family metallopeptidase [Sphingomonas segetis]